MSHIKLPNFVFIAELDGLPENLRRKSHLTKANYMTFHMLVMIILGCSLFIGLGLWIDVW